MAAHLWSITRRPYCGNMGLLAINQIWTTLRPPKIKNLPAHSIDSGNMQAQKGLTTQEAREMLRQFGPNVPPAAKSRRWLLFLHKFWSPIPWLLEIIIILEIALHNVAEAWIVGILLVFNASLSFFQEQKAKKALELLRKQLDVQARVLRDRKWQLIPSRELVPDDLIRIQMGDLLPADVQLIEGSLIVDQSMLTGESMPVACNAGMVAYAGSIVAKGGAFCTVIATGSKTYYGKTAEILKTAQAPAHLETMIFQIVKYLVYFDCALIAIVFLYSLYNGFSLVELVPFSLLLLVASVPVALPATFSLATALGALELVKTGVLVTRLSAIEEAASMNILFVDKTGTITQNTMVVSGVYPQGRYSKDEVLFFAAMASEEATQDPIDLAILNASNKISLQAQKLEFIPFDPDKKYCEALISYAGQQLHIFKGSPIILANGETVPDVPGARFIAVSIEGHFIGFIALSDPPREDAAKLIQQMKELGIQQKMITGDNAITARAVGEKVGIQPADIFANVFPEDKFKIITKFQKEGWICGMTGDGVNDAPALQKAEVGIAVSNAMDIAKAAASLILTKPGLGNILDAIKTSRQIYQRMLTYVLNKIIKTLQIAVLLGVGLILEKQFVISQLLIVLLYFANDFVTMTIATDHVSYSNKPDRWEIKKLTAIALVFAFFILIFSFFALFFGQKILQLSVSQIQTWVFLILVFTGQCTIYLIRERRHFWHSKPSLWMVGSSVLDIFVVVVLAAQGVLMTKVDALLIFGLMAATMIYFVCLDFLKKIFH